MEYKFRKYPRLKEYNYSLPGYYYVTIHNQFNSPLLSQVAPGNTYCRAAVQLTHVGAVARDQLLYLERRYPHVKIDKHVIMPTHMHIIFHLLDGAMPRPGLTDIVGAYKSLTTREINRVCNTPGKRQFQRSFYETVIRNETAYQSCWRYIDENPDKWGELEEAEWDFRAMNEGES